MPLRALEALINQKAYTFLENKRVFHNPFKSQPWTCSKELYYQAWPPIIRLSKVRYRNPYQTRHTYASMMLSNGENPMWVSQQMGHKTLDITLKKYARWIANSGARGGYQLKNDWGSYLQKNKLGLRELEYEKIG